MTRVNCVNSPNGKRCGKQFRVRRTDIKFCRACYKAVNDESRPLNRIRKQRVVKIKPTIIPTTTKRKK